jgi:hypothetical protein
VTEPPAESAETVRVELLGAVAYGALAAFGRLAADAHRAPDLAGRAEVASLAAAEIAHFERVRAHLAERDVEVGAAMAPFVAALDAFAERTTPRDWGEALVAASIGRTLAVDMVLAAGDDAGADSDLVRRPDTGGGFDAFAQRQVAALAADPRVHDRLALWGRRLLGETLAAAATVLDDHPGAASALLGATTRPALFKVLKSRHAKRMQALGL